MAKPEAAQPKQVCTLLAYGCGWLRVGKLQQQEGGLTLSPGLWKSHLHRPACCVHIPDCTHCPSLQPEQECKPANAAAPLAEAARQRLQNAQAAAAAAPGPAAADPATAGCGASSSSGPPLELKPLSLSVLKPVQPSTQPQQPAAALSKPPAAGPLPQVGGGESRLACLSGPRS